MGRTFNFINSVKGGCGKTTVSIFLAKFLQEYGKTLIFDMDLQGTSMEYLFYGNRGHSTKIYLNEAVRKGKEPNECINSFDICTRKLQVIFADPKPETKRKYRSTSATGYVADAQYMVFRNAMGDFLEKLKSYTDIKHLIFDMPPNSDSFSDAAMDCVLKQRNNVLSEGDTVNLFYVTGIEAGSLRVTRECIHDMLLKEENRSFSNLFIVLNDHIAHDEIDTIDLLSEKGRSVLAYEIIGGLDGVLSEKDMRKIWCIWMEPKRKYAAYGMSGRGLQNISEDSFAGRVADMLGNAWTSPFSLKSAPPIDKKIKDDVIRQYLAGLM